MDITADFIYCRLHGSAELYKSRYSNKQLDQWAMRVRDWNSGKPMTAGNFVLPPLTDGRPRDVYVFFDNTDKLQAPDNAQGLMRRLDVSASS